MIIMNVVTCIHILKNIDDLQQNGMKTIVDEIKQNGMIKK